MAYDPNQQYQQPPQYPPPGPQNYQQQPGYPPQGYGQPPMAAPKSLIAQQLGPTSIGLDANIAAALCYFWLIGLIFFFVEKKNRFVRFHALQSMLFGIGLFIVAIVLDYLPYVYFVGSLVHLAWLIGAIYAAVQAYNGKMFKLPIVGDMAERNVSTWVPDMGMPMGGQPNTMYPPQQPGYPPSGQYPPTQGNYPQSGPGYPPQQPPQWPQQ
jgi:uncharacterized membrane protein